MQLSAWIHVFAESRAAQDADNRHFVGAAWTAQAKELLTMLCFYLTKTDAARLHDELDSILALVDPLLPEWLSFSKKKSITSTARLWISNSFSRS